MISKIRHQTCQISDFYTECYIGGGGGGQIYNMVSDKQEHFMQLKIGRN